MKTTLISLFLFIMVMSCTQKKEASISIEGSISPVTQDFILLNQESDIERKISTLVDTIFVSPDGSFKKDLELEPHLYSLNLGPKKSLALAINTGQQLTLTVSDLDREDFTWEVKGSEDAEALMNYEAFRAESLERLVKSIREEIKEVKKDKNYDQKIVDSLGRLEVSNYEKHLKELNTYLDQKMPNTLGLYATSIRWKGPDNIPLYDSLVSRYEKKYPDLTISRKLREKVSRLRQTAVGGTAAPIAMNAADGNTVSLASVKKKYTLIDFWASWCGPCRRESQSLNELYEKYHKDGFEIYGVSLDDNRQKWIDAMEKDHRIWPNVSTLERFKTQAAFDYAVTALPDNYLIDANNTIIAKNIHGEELEDLIEGLINKK